MNTIRIAPLCGGRRARVCYRLPRKRRRSCSLWLRTNLSGVLGHGEDSMSLRLLRQQRHLVAVEPPTVEVLRATAACSHDAHLVHDGRRLGLHVHPSGASASLYPCPHVNEDGL